ncbi:MAG: AzlC family ABC transporter permease [Desulfitobacteriaceae bacterium]|nr:AzlC family ABC transporter permease [Desulfitobacteriaceae bacterium]
MQNKEIRQGITDAMPIVLGYLPLGFAFGVLAKDAGMSVIQAVMMSVLCFTGAGQYLAIGIMQAGGAVVSIILANVLVNLRYLLFATSTVPYLKDRVQPLAASLLSYGLTDETYAVSMNHYQHQPATASYMAGLIFTAHLGWIGSSLLGAVLGSFIPDTDRLGLGFALPAMYIFLLVLMIKGRTDIWVAVLSAGICLIIGQLAPAMMANYSNLIIATIIGATLGVIINGQR